jgi:hypothetical protein
VEHVLLHLGGCRRVDPPLSQEELALFVLQYGSDCIRQDDPEREWAVPPSFVGTLLHHWFRKLWSDKDSA